MFPKNNNHWIIKVGLDPSGDAARRQQLYDAFSAKICNKGLDAELKQTGLMGIVHNEVLVKVSSPDGKDVYYGLTTPDQVERIVNGHLAGGKPITGLVIPDDEIKNFLAKWKETEPKNRSPVENIKQRYPTVPSLIGIALFIGVSIVPVVLGGLLLDNNFGTQPLFMIIFLILGITVATYGVYRMLRPIIRNRHYKEDG